jgi:hypothetical protein
MQHLKSKYKYHPHVWVMSGRVIWWYLVQTAVMLALKVSCVSLAVRLTRGIWYRFVWTIHTRLGTNISYVSDAVLIRSLQIHQSLDTNMFRKILTYLASNLFLISIAKPPKLTRGCLQPFPNNSLKYIMTIFSFKWCSVKLRAGIAQSV